MPRVAFACSYMGPDAAGYYADIARPAYLPWAISVCCAILPVFARQHLDSWRPWTRALIALVVVQPAWWMSTGLGDCGALRDLSAYAIAAVSVIILLFATAIIAWRGQRISTASSN